MKYKLISSLVISAMLSACGGGGDSATTPQITEVEQQETTQPVEPTTYTGVFIDSAVEGLNYTTETQEGTTNENGEFIYQLGEMVTFSIGGISFPPVAVQSQITPLDVFNTEDITNEGVVNMLRLLQTLDEDGIPENGITIIDLAHTLTEDISIDFTDENFSTLIDVALALYSGVNNSLISEESAIQHFTDTLLLNETSSGCSSVHPKVGYTGSFSTIDHNVSGTVTIVDDCTLQVENFNYDATAPAVYFYGDTTDTFLSSNAFTIGDILRDDRVDYVNESITLKLPNNRTLDDLEYLSVWCVDFSVNFGDLRFQAP